MRSYEDAAWEKFLETEKPFRRFLRDIFSYDAPHEPGTPVVKTGQGDYEKRWPRD